MIHRDKNLGLAESIIQGVTEVLQESEKVIDNIIQSSPDSSLEDIIKEALNKL